MGQLENMATFARVVEAGGISKAADQLAIAKSAVSRRLVELESQLGVILLNRTTRAVSLTEVGREYYARAVRVLDDVAELNAQVVDAGSSLTGSIRISAPMSFSLAHLAPALDEFMTLHPALTLNLDFSDRHVDLVEEGFDLALRIGSLSDSSLQARKITPIKRCLCASPKYLAEQGSPKTIKEFKQHELLHYSGSPVNSWVLLDAMGKQHSVSVKSRIIGNNGDFLKDMALAGRGIVFSPTFIVWQELRSGELKVVMEDYSCPDIHAYAVYPKNRYLSQRTRKLIDFLAMRFGDRPYWDE